MSSSEAAPIARFAMEFSVWKEGGRLLDPIVRAGCGNEEWEKLETEEEVSVAGDVEAEAAQTVSIR